jgi:nucleoside-diphosphate-sugar epimerase
VSINQLFATLSEILGVGGQPNYGPPRAGDIVHSYGQPYRAKETLGWQAEVSLADGLRQLVANLKISSGNVNGG